MHVKPRRPVSKAGTKPPLELHTIRDPRIVEAANQAISRFAGRLRADAYSFREQYLRDQAFSKYASAGHPYGSVDVSSAGRREAAIAKWLLAETRNTTTNHRLIFSVAHFRGFTSDDIVRLARKYIRSCIGDCPPITGGVFSDGASTRVKRGFHAVAKKLTGGAHCSRTAMPFFVHAVFERTSWALTAEPPVVQDASTMFTVPKNSMIDRVACKEPEANMYLQRGYGDVIRNRLRRAGIDLNDQSVNRALACEGSKSGKLATLDLSSASDTVSTSLVRLLLPHAWFERLDHLRVKETILPDGTCHRLQMFSSMGNGFTFELESLIFWALARSVATVIRNKGRISVFGDDIICPKRTAQVLAVVLPWFGFILNRKKSFWSGGFRESCGGHYFHGREVTPFYVRKRVEDLHDLIHLHNAALGYVLRFGGAGCDNVFRLIFELRTLVPRQLWGGQQLESKDSLVTGHPPRYRLADPPLKDGKGQQRFSYAPQQGAYIAWLMRTEGRESAPPWTDPVVTSRVPLKKGPVVRRNKSWYDRALAHSVFDAMDWWTIPV